MEKHNVHIPKFITGILFISGSLLLLITYSFTPISTRLQSVDGALHLTMDTLSSKLTAALFPLGISFILLICGIFFMVFSRIKNKK